MLNQVKAEAKEITVQLLEKTKLRAGEIMVIGCSTSEIAAHDIGSHSSAEIGRAVFEGIYEELQKREIYLAAQCCEHLNRAIIIEEKAAEKYGLEMVNVVPQPKAGGSFATAAYTGLDNAVAVEEVCAHAGIDIGDTLIGMHLKRVAVPVRIDKMELGAARVVCARTRPKFIGGERAGYNEKFL